MAAKNNTEEITTAVKATIELKFEGLNADIAARFDAMREQLAQNEANMGSLFNQLTDLIKNQAAAKSSRKTTTAAAKNASAVPESASSFWRVIILTNEACVASLMEKNEAVVEWLKKAKKATISELSDAQLKSFNNWSWDYMISGSLNGVDLDGNDITFNRTTVGEMMQKYKDSKAAAADAPAEANDEISEAVSAVEGEEGGAEEEDAATKKPTPAAAKKAAATAKKPAAAAAKKAAPAAAPATPKAATAKTTARRTATAK